MSTSELWNKAEAAEVRKNSVVARELVVALPHELDREQRIELADKMAGELVERYKVAAEVSVHLPDKEGDKRNHHAHIMFTTREMDSKGELGAKTRVLDDRIKTGPEEVQWMRGMVESKTNEALERAGRGERIDMRSLADQRTAALEAGDHERAKELDRPATQHEGPRVTQIRREAEKAGREPLGALDRAAANDSVHGLVKDRLELKQVSAQIIDFEKARAERGGSGESKQREIGRAAAEVVSIEAERERRDSPSTTSTTRQPTIRELIDQKTNGQPQKTAEEAARQPTIRELIDMKTQQGKESAQPQEAGKAKEAAREPTMRELIDQRKKQVQENEQRPQEKAKDRGDDRER